MHYNPCGRAVDWIKQPFEVDAILHDGPNPPVERVRWMFTDQPAIEGESVINNRSLNEDHDSELSVGQLIIDDQLRRSQTGGKLYGTWAPGVECNYAQDARWTLPHWLVAKPNEHVCHPEWFAEGEPWPNALPPTEYGDSHIPLCCGTFDPGGFEIGGPVVHTWGYLHAPSGGVMFGGAVAHTWSITHAPTGGVVLGGAVVHAFGFEHAPEGGVSFGGAVAHTWTIEHAPEGGVSFGGLVQHNDDYQNAPTGGVVMGGDVTRDYTIENAPEGGVMFGGAVAHTWSITHAPTGGVVLGGAVVHAFGFIHVPLGGVVLAGANFHTWTIQHAPLGGDVFGGAVAHAFGFEHAPTGGVVFGGAVTHTYNPGSPTPGNSCATAGAMTVGQSYTGPSSAFATDWFTFPQVNGTQYTVHFTAAGSLQHCDAGHGSCPLPISDGSVNGTGNITWTAGSTATGFIQVGPNFGGGNYTMSLTSP